MSCAQLLLMNDITIAQFYACNKAVGPQCENLWHGKQSSSPRSSFKLQSTEPMPGHRYCIRITPYPDEGQESTIVGERVVEMTRVFLLDFMLEY